jgi:predicted DsbA family dithiol-disulfide isomerase
MGDRVRHRRGCSGACRTIYLSITATIALLLAAGSVSAQTVAKPQVLAELDGQAITAEEVERSIGAPLARLEEEAFLLKRQKIESMIEERLLARTAAERGLSLQALLNAEVVAKTASVTPEEVDQAYISMKSQVPGDEASVKQRIQTLLAERKLAARRQAFVESLRSKVSIAVHLKSPPPFHPDVNSEGAASKGRPDAAVTIVEFQDFHCPYCQQVQPVLAQLASRYGDRVRLVYRDFPIDQLHPQARRAHEAARCAQDQGGFWAYHDLLYANAPKASPDELIGYAKQAGMDVERFEKCTTSREHRLVVQRDIDEGIRAGVTGTPTFFINGQPFSGALPLEAFSRLIDDQLTRAN